MMVKINNVKRKILDIIIKEIWFNKSTYQRKMDGKRGRRKTS